ncbi:MAG: helix-turn-helix transcriptional regulator, partial [Janthinobacterium sp.]
MAMRLKLLRKHKGWTLEQLAEKSGLTKSYLSKVERGLSVPSIAVALKLSQAMQVDVEQLFSDSHRQAAVTITRAGDPGGAGAMPPLPHFASIAAGVAPKKMLPFMVYPAPDFAASAFK